MNHKERELVSEYIRENKNLNEIKREIRSLEIEEFASYINLLSTINIEKFETFVSILTTNQKTSILKNIIYLEKLNYKAFLIVKTVLNTFDKEDKNIIISLNFENTPFKKMFNDYINDKKVRIDKEALEEIEEKVREENTKILGWIILFVLVMIGVIKALMTA